MKTITKKITLYEFKELSEEKQDKLINEEINFIFETIDFDTIAKNSNVYKAIKKAEAYSTPWFVGSIYYHDFNGKKTIIKDLKRYYFDEDLNYYNK